MQALVKCPQCDHAYRLDERYFGRRVQCKCGLEFRVPVPAPPIMPAVPQDRAMSLSDIAESTALPSAPPANVPVQSTRNHSQQTRNARDLILEQASNSSASGSSASFRTVRSLVIIAVVALVGFVIHPAAGGIGAFLAFCWCFSDFFAGVDGRYEHLDGQELKSSSELQAASRQLQASGRKTISWGGVLIPEDDSMYHFCLVGSTGSGKTLSMRLVMQEVLPEIGAYGTSDCRAVIYDPKGDMVQLLAGMNLPCKVHLLNPFDARGVSWNIAADVTTPTLAREMASILFPEKQESQPFFSNAARALVADLMTAFNALAPGQWTLRDVILGATNQRHLKRILESFLPPGHQSLSYFEGKEFPSVITTISAGLSRFDAVASAWSVATESISLTGWSKDQSILILGTDPTIQDVMSTVNAMLVHRLCQVLLSQSESSTRRAWVFLDEFTSTAELKGLPELLRTGRSKGVCVMIGFQDVGGLKNSYGENMHDGITGMCYHVGFFRIEDSTTAEWASERMGEELRKEWSESKSSGKESSTTTSYQTQWRRIVPADYFKQITPPSKERGLQGYYISRAFGRHHHTYSGSFMNEALAPKDESKPTLIPRQFPQVLPAWTSEDLERLNLTAVITGAAPVTHPATPAVNHTPKPPAVPDGNHSPAAPRKSSLWQMGKITPPPRKSS